MSIDIMKDELLTLAEAAKCLPLIRSKKIAVSTLWRWCVKGMAGVYLEYARIGHRIFTSREAMNTFALAHAVVRRHKFAKAEAEAVDAAFTEHLRKDRPRTERQRQRDLAEADRILNEAGI
ncbi:MAG: DUF1580 domain-containing protein [Planctomycetaceae bacterium]|nr:DUF1580 domain-containing protein [Planctomycetaceae bacterium]